MNQFAQPTINNSELILDSIARATKNGFVAYNLENKITHFSPKMEEVTGWLEAEMLGKDVTQLCQIKAEGLVENPHSVESKVVALFTRNGKHINIEARCTGVLSQKSKLEGYLMFFIIEDFRRDLDRAQSEFISTVSHELRTPITSIKGFASTLLSAKQKIDEEKRNKYLRIIREQADRLSRLVEDLLAVSRLESRKLQLTIHPVLLKPIIENVCEVVGSKHKYSHDVSIVCPADLPEVWVDNDRLEQILTNLIDNAFKYAPEVKKVDIEVSKAKHNDKDMVLVAISDYGIGIRAEDQKKIFTKFSRLDSPLTRVTEGTGLGLYISYSLTKLLGGELSVTSSAGKTTFSLFLSTKPLKGGEVWWD